MSALKFTCEACGSSQYKTEVWKDGLDKTRFNTKAIFEDSKGRISSIHGSHNPQNNFESFLNFNSGKNEKEEEDLQADEIEKDPVNTSLKTFRMVTETTPENGEPNFRSPLDYQEGESVIVYDITPAKLEFKSDLDDEDKPVTTDENGMPFNPNDLYKVSTPDVRDSKLEVKDDKNVNVSDAEDF